MAPLLGGKNAVIYGAGGAIGGAVARAFAGQIRSIGDWAGAAVVDVFDKRRDEESINA
jgi:NAD(P)-dependent dehydrogenase (short-subunit alcohol dehydrogenase family)